MRGLLAFALCVSLGAISAVSALAVEATGASPGPSVNVATPGSSLAPRPAIVTDTPPAQPQAAAVEVEPIAPHGHAPKVANPVLVAPPAAAPLLVAEERVEAELPALATVPAPQPEEALAALSFPELAASLFADMNRARVSDALGVLATDEHLDGVAMVRAQDLAAQGYFDHYAPDGSSAFSELAERGIPYRIAGENLARNNYPRAQTADVAFTALMESPGHRANILEPRFARVGTAAVFDGEFWIFVTVFSD